MANLSIFNPFSLFELPEVYALNLKELEEKYLALQLKWHPDQFNSKSVNECSKAEQKSAEINRAYEILKNPVKRAEYIIRIWGIEPPCTDAQTIQSPELLEEIFALKERLYACQNTQEWKKINQEIKGSFELCCFNFNEVTAETPQLIPSYLRLVYLSKLFDQVHELGAQIATQGFIHAY